MAGVVLYVLFLLIPVVILGVFLVLPFLFGRLFHRNHHKIWLLAMSLSILFIVSECFVVQPVVKGEVTDALSGRPIEGITVERVFFKRRAFEICLEAYMCPEEILWQDMVKTDERGLYYFPAKIFVTIPIFETFKGGLVHISLCKLQSGNESVLELCRSQENKEFWSRYNKQNYFGWKNKLLKLDHPFSFSGPLEYEIEIESGRQTNILKTRYNVFPINREIYLIPLVDSLNECESAVRGELAEECRDINAIRLAVKMADPKLCRAMKKSDRSYLPDLAAVRCIREVAIINKNSDFCYEMEDLISKGRDLDDNLNNCLKNSRFVGD